jgi:excinuclease ABC subunit C
MDGVVIAEALERKIQSLPARPGVYQLRDRRGEILYIGKANSLRARVRSHFAADAATSAKNREMLRRVADVDTIVVDSEAEALLLEANLIKQHRPRFNIRLRDDKRYPYIKVTVQEPFPRVYVTRRLTGDGARYFGPYTDVGAMRLALDVIRRLYTVRSCRYDLPREAPQRPCLDYHIGRCRAPCVGLQSQDDYGAMIGDMMGVLSGRVAGVRERVRLHMANASAALDFERAATLRDVLAGLENIEQRQRALDVRARDVDVLGTARDGDRACVVLLRVRQGRLLGREVVTFEEVGDEADAAILGAALSRFYLGRGEAGFEDLPREALLPLDVPDRGLLEEILTERAGRRVETTVPQRGDKLRLIALAAQNARHLLEERALLTDSVRARAEDVLFELQEALSLKVVPRLIVCFDISHTQGAEVVGSAIVFRNGEPDRDGYRRFRIRGDWGNDDFRSMHEVVSRYFSRQIVEKRPLPELAVIDGGRPQLGAAVAAAREAGAADVAIIALAKREEAIHVQDRPAPLRLARTGGALRLLQRVRNEAHRFAITYNRSLRAKRTLASELTEIPGVGRARRQALLTRFGSVKGVRQATPEDIAALPGFSAALAARIMEHLAGQGGDGDGTAG